jgi:hypothetical protein
MLRPVDMDWPKRFPRLLEDSYVDYAAARISYVPGAAPEALSPASTSLL